MVVPLKEAGQFVIGEYPVIKSPSRTDRPTSASRNRRICVFYRYWTFR